MKLHVSIGMACVLAVSAAAFGCSAGAGGDLGSDEEHAEVGIPTKPVFGSAQYTANGLDFTLEKRDAKGNLVSTLVRHGVYAGSGISIDGDKYGPALNKSPNQNYGYFSNTPWTCQQAELFATDQSSSADPNQKCYLEINTTANNGVSVVIIGLDAKGGSKPWSGEKCGSSATATACPDPVAVQKVDPTCTQRHDCSGPRGVNVKIDAKAVGDAMVAARDHFRAPIAERNDCLKNARTSRSIELDTYNAWLDIQAHYYCLLPYGDVRTCYSTNLVQEITKAGADPKAAAMAPRIAYDTCFTKASPGSNAAWVHQNQEAVFKYIMFTKQGAADFDVDSENDVINAFYAGREDRPRRVVDTIPKWIAEQPRYEVVRKLQRFAQHPSEK